MNPRQDSWSRVPQPSRSGAAGSAGVDGQAIAAAAPPASDAQLRVLTVHGGKVLAVAISRTAPGWPRQARTARPGPGPPTARAAQVRQGYGATAMSGAAPCSPAAPT